MQLLAGIKEIRRRRNGSRDNENEVQIIEERFVAIETSVEFLQKEIDGIEIPNVSEIESELAAMKVQLSDSKEDIQELKEKLKDLDKNPLAN